MHGADGDPDAALRSPGRRLLLTSSALVAAVGVLFLVVGSVAAPDPGESRSAVPVVVGAILLATGLSATVSATLPGARVRMLPATTVDGGIELPLRPAHRYSSIGSGVSVLLMGAAIVVLGDDGAARALGAALAIGGAALTVLTARHRPVIRLDPDGLTLPSGPTRNAPIAWRDVVEVAAVGGWRPTLVVTWRGPGLSACFLLPQAWAPSRVVAVIEHFRTHAADRSRLTDPAVLDRIG